MKLVIGLWVETREAATFWFLNQVMNEISDKFNLITKRDCGPENLCGSEECRVRSSSGGSEHLDTLALRLPGIKAPRAGGGSGFLLLGGGLAVGSSIGPGGFSARAFGGARSGFLLGSFFLLFLVIVLILRILLRLPSVRRDTENNSKLFLSQSVELEMKC
jgi:hypothetical protein